MSTVADDLLNDFGSSGDEADDLEKDGLVLTEKTTNGNRDAMDVDDDENEEASDDDEGAGAMKDMEDTEATKAKVEKMQLGAVKDVRSVASLMQTLEPILEVSRSLTPYPYPQHHRHSHIYLFFGWLRLHRFRDEQLALTCWLEYCRKSPITSHNLPRSKPTSAISKTIPSITC